MKTTITAFTLTMSIWAGLAMAEAQMAPTKLERPAPAGGERQIAVDQIMPAEPQVAERPEGSAGHRPPPQAFADCQGKKAGDTVQHSTPDGTVDATCVESPDGLVARPNQPRPGSEARRGGRPAPEGMFAAETKGEKR